MCTDEVGNTDKMCASAKRKEEVKELQSAAMAKEQANMDSIRTEGNNNYLYLS